MKAIVLEFKILSESGLLFFYFKFYFTVMLSDHLCLDTNLQLDVMKFTPDVLMVL